MPTIEYKCKQCGHAFKRLVLKGDNHGIETCPECQCSGVKPLTQSPRLFEGISDFSTLAKDTN